MSDEKNLSDVEKPKAGWMWMRDTAGYPSVSVTFAAVSFWVTTLAFVLSLVEGIGPIKFRTFDVAACSAYLVPFVSLYFGRRWTDAKYNVTKSE